MTAPTEHDREALAKHIEKIEAFRKEHFIPQADHPEVGSPWQQAHNETLNQCCNAAIAALTTQGGEQTAVAWLICRADGSRDVVLSPLTDDTPMDYGDEAWPLVHQSSMPDSTDGQTADTVSVPRKLLYSFPELNPANYSEDDVVALNNWGIEVVLAAAKEGK